MSSQRLLDDVQERAEELAYEWYGVDSFLALSEEKQELLYTVAGEQVRLEEAAA